METAEKYGWGALTSAAYALARRPRGQQLLRQADRVLDVIERIVRWLTGGDGLSSSSGYFPVSVVTMLMLLFIVLPSFLLCVVILSIPILPFMLPFLVLAPFRKARREGTTETFLSVCTTPHLMATFINRKRRTLRAIRLEGIREIRYGEALSRPDSLVTKLFIWWPVAVLATFGSFIGLGGPYIPVSHSPSTFKMFILSPGKRKYHLQGGSDEEFVSAESEEEMLDESSSDESELVIPSDTSLTIIRRLSGTIEALNSSVNPDDSDESSDPDYQPGLAETDSEELEVEDEEENESNVEGENVNSSEDGKKKFLGENVPTPEVDTESVQLKGEAVVTPSASSIPREDNCPSKSEVGDEQTEPAVTDTKADHVDPISSPSLDIHEERLLTEHGKDTTGTLRKAAEESVLFLQAEGASSGLAEPEQESTERIEVESAPKEENIGNEDEGKRESDTKDSSKSKPRFRGLFRRGSDK